MKKSLIFSGLISLVISVSSLLVYSFFNKNYNTVKIEHINGQTGNRMVYSLDSDGKPVSLDFHETAKAVLDGVVHIKSTHVFAGNSQNYQFRMLPDPFRDFFEDENSPFYNPQFRFNLPSQPKNQKDLPTQVGTGSGVIISQDGYIVTNNHVIAQADDIEVTLHDNRSYKAVVVGTDPSTDLALIQIKEKNLPTVAFINSDDVQVGQWVMAVGNPMGLNSTVTAGIVSAKGRNINILKDQYAVENFIQTDAAINPGNSGGALVDLSGGLVGINTAIASPTGSFAGYGFAIPSNIVNKVVQDLLQYGMVQRAILGVMVRTIDGNFAKEKNLKLTQGVFVESFLENSAAAKAGLKLNDIILAVDDLKVNSASDLQGAIARHRPGEEVELQINRDGKESSITVLLMNKDGNAEIRKKEKNDMLNVLGVELENIEKELANKLEIDGGVKVKKLFAGKILKYTQMKEGFIITAIDGEKIKSVDDFLKSMKEKKGGVMIEGVYENIPGEYYYAFGL